jgi:hypothetical protein
MTGRELTLRIATIEAWRIANRYFGWRGLFKPRWYKVEVQAARGVASMLDHAAAEAAALKIIVYRSARLV